MKNIKAEGKKQEKTNIVLIGMPGSGKSTIGVVLAKILGYGFADTDLVIQEKTGKRLFELIAEYGNEEFLELESRINAEFQAEYTVIAPGGSVCLEEEAMKHYKDIATIVYLKIDCESLQKRLGNLEKRGVVLEPGTTLENLYHYRAPYYEKYADIILEEGDMDTSSLAMQIAEILKLR